MKYIDMGDIKASRLMLGCMRIADKPIKNIERLISSALGMGINAFDNADIYGGGTCEIKFGKALKNLKIARDKTVIQTKCGICGGMYDLSYDHIIRSVNGSLDRLGTDYIDILLLHRPDTLMRPENIARAFDDLYSSGKVRAFGVSNFSAQQTDLIQTYTDKKIYVDQLQLSPTHCPIIDYGINVNTLNSGAYDTSGGVLEYCRKNKITIQAYGVMQCAFTDETGYFYSGSYTTEHAKKKYFALNYTLEGIARKYGTTPEAVAVAWLLYHPADMQAIVGTTLDKHLKAFEDCCEVSLTRYEWYEIFRSAGHTLP